jgi:hypothetical protein
MMTARIAHVIDLTRPGSDNPTERLPAESFKPHKVATAEYLQSRGVGKLLGLGESWKDLDEDNTGAGTLHGDLFIIPTVGGCTR